MYGADLVLFCFVFFSGKRKKEGSLAMLLVMALYVIVVDADIDCVPVESLHRCEQYRLENVGVV